MTRREAITDNHQAIGLKHIQGGSLEYVANLFKIINTILKYLRTGDGFEGTETLG
jgi:hypothetical protein